MTTTGMIIQTETSTYSTIIETFLPEFNIIVPSKKDNDDKLKDIINNPLELKDLNSKLKEINNDLNNNQNNFLTHINNLYILWLIVNYNYNNINCMDNYTKQQKET